MKHLQAQCRWLALLAALAVIVGSSSAFFLWALDAVTLLRFRNPWLLAILPLAGLAIGWLYHRHGSIANLGNSLIIREIQQRGGEEVPLRMAPLILSSTLLTHLAGGSAGREGTAVQMAGGIAAALGRWLKIDAASRPILLRAGVAAGFGAVFGTPLAGAVFALEVTKSGRLNYRAWAACGVAAFAANWICQAWGTEHTRYLIHSESAGLQIAPWQLGKVVIAAMVFGLTSMAYLKGSKQLTAMFNHLIPRPELRPVLGGCIVIGLFLLAATPDYLGLGVLPNRDSALTLPAFFTATPVPATAWLWKLIFTLVTLSAGFKGGEVTPLFFIGAALGNTLASALAAPTDLFAGLGMIAIFAGASNAPMASIILGLELFGPSHGICFVTACLIAHRCSGKNGIYRADN